MNHLHLHITSEADGDRISRRREASLRSGSSGAVGGLPAEH
jgi:hypothetical protein